MRHAELTQVLYTRIPEPLKKKIDQLARRNNWTQAHAARHLLELGLKEDTRARRERRATRARSRSSDTATDE